MREHVLYTQGTLKTRSYGEAGQVAQVHTSGQLLVPAYYGDR